MSRTGRIALRLVFPAVCLAGVVLIVSELDLSGTLELAASADLYWILLALVPLLLRFWIWAFKWKLMTADHWPEQMSATWLNLIFN